MTDLKDYKIFIIVRKISSIFRYIYLVHRNRNLFDWREKLAHKKKRKKNLINAPLSSLFFNLWNIAKENTKICHLYTIIPLCFTTVSWLRIVADLDTRLSTRKKRTRETFMPQLMNTDKGIAAESFILGKILIFLWHSNAYNYFLSKTNKRCKSVRYDVEYEKNKESTVR